MKLLLVVSLLVSGPALADTTWATATGELDGHTIIYRYVEKLPAGFKTESQPERVDISWSYGDANNGMPPPDVNERQIRFEDLLAPLEPSIATLAVVRTGGGDKTWVYYTSNTDVFMRRLNDLLASEPRFPIEIVFNDDKQWALYWRFWRSVDRSTSDSGS